MKLVKDQVAKRVAPDFDARMLYRMVDRARLCETSVLGAQARPVWGVLLVICRMSYIVC